MQALLTKDAGGFGYCRMFDMERPPFQDGVNPDFFFQTQPHEEALVRLLVCCQQRRALGLLTGQSGTGKTLLSQLLLTHLEQDEFQPVVVLGHPGMTQSGLLRSILRELHVPLPAGRVSAETLLGLVEQACLDAYALGRRLVVLVDEAHFLPAVALHTVRTLTNLETPEEKLVTVLLFAEEFILRRLRHPRFRSLRSRVAMRAHLRPLTPEETEQFLKFRLLVAGGRPDVFTPEAYSYICTQARGVPREALRYADVGCLEAYFKSEPQVGESLLAAALENGFL